MSSVQAFREFVNERLSAAAGEIFTVFEQTIVRYEAEIGRQHKLLEIFLKPQIKLHRTELPQHHDRREEQLCKQEPNYCVEQERLKPLQIKGEEPGLLQFIEDQEEPEPSQIEEHEELGTSQNGEQLILKFASDSLNVPSIEEQSYLNEAEEVADTAQFLSHDSEIHHVDHVDSESVINAELKTVNVFQGDLVENVPVSEKQAEHDKFLCEKMCGEVLCKKRKLCQNVGTVSVKKKIICEICAKSYSAQSSLLVHMRTHTGEKPYCCETCGKRFSDQSNLYHHMRTHTGERPHACETCGKRFFVLTDLSRHMRTHTGEKPYSCQTCFKSFCRRDNLLHHMRTHTGEKPHTCETCFKTFRRQSHLLSHMRTHPGEKPYSCDTCGESFSHNNLLLCHVKTHQEMKQHQVSGGCSYLRTSPGHQHHVAGQESSETPVQAEESTSTAPHDLFLPPSHSVFTGYMS